MAGTAPGYAVTTIREPVVVAGGAAGGAVVAVVAAGGDAPGRMTGCFLLPSEERSFAFCVHLCLAGVMAMR